MENLIELFNTKPKGKSAEDRICLKIIRRGRQEKISFGQLKNNARGFACWLMQKKKILAGDKIAILGKNRVNWDVAFWGSILAGAVPVLIDPERKTEDVKNHLIHTESRILIVADDYLDNSPDIPGLDIVEMTSYERIETAKIYECIRLNEYKIKPEDTAVILCTSGTTDNPKEVELSHQNLIANIQGSIDLVKINQKDKLLHILPAHHSFGLTVGKLLPFWVGATNIYTDKYQEIARLIKDEKASIFMAVPALFKIMAKKLQGLSSIKKTWLRRIKWKKLRFCVSGSAPMPMLVLKTFWESGIELREGYGTTENSPVYGFNVDRNKLGSVGKPIPTLSVKIAGDGEILLAGPCITKGYYKNPEATKVVIEQDKDGTRWLHTGDLGSLDEDGCLYITGRKKYVIVLPDGKKVNPEKVELLLSQSRYIKDILVVPLFVGDKQETIGALVQPNPEEITSKKIIWQSIQEYQKELALFERISSIDKLEIVEKFEKTPTGKIKREVYLLK